MIYRRPKKPAAVSRPFRLIARFFLAMYNWLVSFLGRQPSGEPKVHRGQYSRRPRMPAVEPAVMPVHRISDTARETCPVFQAQKLVSKFSAASNEGGLSKGSSMSYPGSPGLTPHKRPTCASQPSGTKLVEEFPPGGLLEAREGSVSRGLSRGVCFGQPNGRRSGPGRIPSAKISQTVTVTCEEVDASFRQSNAPPVRPLICPVPARVTRRPMAARPPVRSSEDICSAQPDTGSVGATGRGPPEGRQRAGPGPARSSGGRARSSGGCSCSSGGRARSSGGRARSSGGPAPQPVVPSAGPQRVLPSASPLPVLPTAAPLLVLPTATAEQVQNSEDICSAEPETVAAGATGRGPAEGQQRAGPGCAHSSGGRARSSGGRARSSGGRARSSGGRARSSGGRDCSSGGRARSSGGPAPQPVVPSAGPQRVLPSAGPLPVLPTAAPLLVLPTATAEQVQNSEDISQPETGSVGATGRGPPEGRQRAGPGRSSSSGGRARFSGVRACSSGGRARSSGGRARSSGGRDCSSGGPAPQPVVPSAGPQRVLPSAGPLPVLPTAAPLLVLPTATAEQVQNSEDISQPETGSVGATGRGPPEGRQRAGPGRSRFSGGRARFSGVRARSSGGHARSSGGRARSSGGPAPPRCLLMAGPLPVIFPPAPQQVPPWTNQQVLMWPGPLPVPPWAAPATSGNFGHILCTSVAQPSSPQLQPAPARASLKRRAAAMSQPHTIDEGEVEAKKARRTVAQPSTSVSEQKKMKKKEKRRLQRQKRRAAKPSPPQVQPASACAPHKRHADAVSQEIQTRKRARTMPPAQPSSPQEQPVPGPSAVLSEQKRRKRQKRRQRQRRNRAIKRALQAQSASTLQASSSTAVSQPSISSAIDSLERKLFCLSVQKK
nr:translation initiation factor IF-2-like isoform X2 [Misgurnus anguillicaudatus]